MIEYAFLCQTIADWRAGRRPSLPPSATPTISGSGVSSTAPVELYPEIAPELDHELEPELDHEVANDLGHELAPDLDHEAANEPSLEEDGDSDLLEVEEQLDAAPNELDGDPTEIEVAPDSPPDYDSTMVYGSEGALSEVELPADDDLDPEVRDR